MPITKNMAPIEEAVKGTVANILNGFISQLSDADLPAAQAITSRMTAAIRHNDQETADECKAQLAGLVQAYEVQLEGFTNSGIQMVVDIGLQAVFSAAVGGLNGLKVV